MHPAQLVWKKADHPSDSLNTKTETWGLLSLDRFILFVGMPSVPGIPRLVHSVAVELWTARSRATRTCSNVTQPCRRRH